MIPDFSQKGMDLGIERIKDALKSMGNPCFNIPAIQVAGTNGKGSIASFLKWTLIEAGIKVGVTTSPHLIDWRERISVNREFISSRELRNRISSIKPFAEINHLTPFEILIAVAFEHFAANDVELLVLEVGLGGRLDATTAHPYRPLIAIGSIGLDHCQHLGKTLHEIASEKAAVITPGSTVISAKQHPDVVKVLKRFAKENNAHIKWVSPVSNDWKLGLDGIIQKQNAAVAKGTLEALSKLGWEINEGLIKKGFSLTHWPARMQKAFWKGFPLLIDVAHNPQAAEQLSKERETWINNKLGIKWIFGIQRHKEGPQIIRNLIKQKDKALILEIPGHLSWTYKDLCNSCPELSSQLFNVENIEELFSKFLSRENWPQPPPVVAGSIYLAGYLLAEKIIYINETNM